MGRQARRRQARQHPRSGTSLNSRGSRSQSSNMPWWLGPWGVGGAIVIVAAIVVILVVVNNNKKATSNAQASSIGKPVPASVLKTITHPSASTLAAVGSGGNKSPWLDLKVHKPIIVGGKPSFVYLGAEYCPYCAAERWSMISALSRFGKFKGLALMESSSSDVYADTNTFTFLHAKYTSPYINFLHVEEQDRQQRSLQQLTSVEASVEQYDAPPFVPSADANGIPFLDMNNEAVSVSSGYLPSVINGQSWQKIATQLKNPSSSVARAVLGNANWISAAICKTTKNKPASVCKAAPIPSLEKQLKIG